MAGMIALNRSQEIMDAWAGVFGSIASAPTTNATLNALVRANAPPRQAAVAVLDNATSSGSNARNASKSALCETLAPAKVTPSSLSARSIAEDARLHRMWEDSIRELHGGSGKAGRALREYLNVIEAGELQLVLKREVLSTPFVQDLLVAWRRQFKQVKHFRATPLSVSITGTGIWRIILFMLLTHGNCFQ